MFLTKKFYYLDLYSVILYIFYFIEPTFSAIHGRYTKDIEQYELSLPHRVTSTGDFITFSIPQFFEHKFEKRFKRDTVPNEKKIYYNIIFEGKDHHLEVWPNHGFVSPDLVTEFYQGNIPVAKRQLKRMTNKLCHYVGKVKGEKHSSVAISVCDGLAGYVKTDKGEYFIEPIAEHQANEHGQHVHVIYKRKLTDPTSSFGYPWVSDTPKCGTKEKWVDGWTRSFREVNPAHDKVIHTKNHYLEILAVADMKFYEYHKHNNIEIYVMTIMNMVANFYHDSSIGSRIDLHVVRIIYIDKPETVLDLSISSNAEVSLQSFCQWAKQMNPRDPKNPQHHDIAVLLSRYDLCSDNVTDCNLMGLAYLAAACNPDESCTINEDSGLELGITVTHEIGHILGCGHDNGEDSPCQSQDDAGDYFVMSPFIHMATTKWSPCSKKFMTELFENGLGKCLEDEPEESLFKQDLNILPGVAYGADYQCNSDFPGMVHCILEEAKICEMLYCKDEGTTTCVSKGEPPADGTKCGENMWCFRGKCVEMGMRPLAIDGGWGEWKPWTDCSRSCGGGISISERECNNPLPANHGRYCIGEAKRVKMCNINECSGGGLTFREHQCSDFNNKPFKNKLHAWKPYFVDGHECELTCINEERVYVTLSPRVKDGTPCKPGTKDRCIFGVCEKVGCDWIIGSSAIEDVCGICNGDGTHCKVYRSEFNGTGHGYHKFAVIPAGVHNLRVNEKRASQNTIAAASEDSKQFYLNANFTEEHNGDKDFGDVKGIYDHPAEDKETLFIRGPLKKPIVLYEVFYGPENPGIEYSYTIPTTGKQVSSQFLWEYDDYSPCSTHCGPGVKIAKPMCVEKTRGRVSDKFCSLDTKPEEKIIQCNLRPCINKWRPNSWSKCTGCKFRPGTKTRTVDCVREATEEGKDPVIVEDCLCKEVKPKTKEMCCSNEPCKPQQRLVTIEQKYHTDEAENAISKLWPQLRKIQMKQKMTKVKKENIPENQKFTVYKPERMEFHTDLRDTNDNMEIFEFKKIPVVMSHQKMENNDNKILKRKCDEKNKENITISKDLSCYLKPSSPPPPPPQKRPVLAVADRLPSQGNQLIEVPVKEFQQEVKISDEAYEGGGDKVADTLDFCNSKIYKGKAADKEIKRLKYGGSKTSKL